MKKYSLGFDLGGTKMMAALLDEDFKVTNRERAKTRDQNGRVSVTRIIETMLDCLKDAKVEAKDLRVIGIGVPGAVDRKKGVVINAPNLGWENLPLRERLEKALDRPVFLENDVNCGTYGEFRLGAARKCCHVLGIFPGTGIGGGLIIDGKLLGGATGMAGEIGHVIIDRNGPSCGCGKNGCLEAMASRLAIAREAAVAVMRGKAPNLAKETGADLEKIKSGALARAIKAGDTAIEKIVRRAARLTGLAAANAANLISPEIVVIGGGLAEAMPEIYKREVEKALGDYGFPALVRGLKVAVAELGDDAVAVGAAVFAADMLAETKDEKDKKG